MWPEPIGLRGTHAALQPLAREHHDGLVDAVRDGELWRLWYTSVPSPEQMAGEIERRLGLQASGAILPFTVFDAAGRIAGMTTYMNVDAVNRRVEIGSTSLVEEVSQSSSASRTSASLTWRISSGSRWARASSMTTS